MKKFVFAGVSLLLGCVIWLAYQSTSEIPENEQLIEVMNDRLKGQDHVKEGTVIKRVQDKQMIDDRHLYIPVVFEDGSHGKSIWVDGWFKWKLVQVNTDGSPEVWEIDPGNPSTYHVIYHLEGVHSMDLYYRKDLYWSISHGKDSFYQPPIQLKKKISLDRKSYGTEKLPEVWSEIYSKANKNKGPFMNIGYITYDENGNVINTTPYSKSTYTFGGNENFSFVRVLNKNDIVE